MINENIVYILLSGIMQGLTEFLPISSSGHLILLNYFFNKHINNLDFEILLHFGTIFSIIFYYKKDLLDIIKKVFFNKDLKILLLIILGCIPISLIGLFGKNYIAVHLNNVAILPYTFIFTAFFLFMTKYQYGDKKITINIVLIMSLFQILALLPGISRSGITISILLMLGVSIRHAVKFSFLMAIPLISGATLMTVDFTNYNSSSIQYMLLGAFVSFLFGWIAIYLTNYFLLNRRYWIFSIYCFTISIISYLIV